MSSLHDTARKAAEKIVTRILEVTGAMVQPSTLAEADIEATAIIERHFAAHQNSQWKLIADAPKDGRSVIILRGNRPQVVAFYGVFRPNAQGRECWRVEYTNQPIAFFKGEITLFRDLPTPPSEVTE